MPVTTSDFTPFAQAAAARSRTSSSGTMAPEQNLGVIPALRRSGYAGPYVVAAYGVSEDTVRQAAQRAGSGENVYLRHALQHRSRRQRAGREVAEAQKKYGLKPFSSMHITGWARQVRRGSASRTAAACTREKLDKAHADPQGRYGRPDRRTDRDVAARPLRPVYWRLYGWKTTSWSRSGDWLRRTR